MRTCYLHIGAPKAGSTTIQGFLGDYRGALRARGVDVPDFGHDGDVVTGALALSGGLNRERNAARPKTKSWQWLDRHLSTTSTDVCISREGLCNHLGDARPYAFAKKFFRRRGVEMRLIAYVRDHVGYLNAAYAQQAKKFRTDDRFEDWLTGALASARYGYWRRFGSLLSDPKAEFSIKSLNQLGDGGLLPDFCAQIGCPDLDVSGFDADPYRNATPGPKALAAGLLVARGLKERGVDPDFDQSLHRRFRLAVEARDWRERPFFGPDDTSSQRILDAFAEGNEKLARAAWGLGWQEAAPTTRREPNVFVREAASAEDVRDVDDLAREILATAIAPARGWRRLFARAQPAGLVTPSQAP